METPDFNPAPVLGALRRAKIVCTLGPSSSTEEMHRQLLRDGMNVARLNFSHGTHEEHARMIERVRKVTQLEGKVICLLQDLQGPKMRTGKLQNRTPVALKAGARFVLTGRDVPGTAEMVSTTFPIARDVQPGARILLSDGLIELRVIKVEGEDVETEVINGGLLGEHKGINLPGTPVSLPSITDKDKADVAFGLKHGIDMVAMSFVRTADDVLQAKRYISSLGGHVPVIAKLEKPQAIENLESIFEVADGVMVARGDLGVEVPPEQVPIIQKHIIKRAAEWRKPVITATQMLESMIENPRPTRAEASDVANAIFDGTDAVMLSGETASGKYPREAVCMMSRIIVETETHMREMIPTRRRRNHKPLSITETICESVAHAAEDLDMKAIAVFTQTGTTARLVSKYHPKCAVYAFAHEPAITNQMNLLWGVQPILCDIAPTAEDMVRGAEEELSNFGVVKNGDVMGVISGTIGASGSTNIMRLHTVGTDNISGDLSSDRRKTPRQEPPSTRERK
ncbi:MAG: pyruvate kinase [Terriglobales bacterium]